MRVAHILPTLSVGGLWRQAHYLNYFPKESFEMIVINIFKGISGPEFPLPFSKVVSLSREVHEHRQRSSIINQLIEVFKRENIKLVHSYHYFTDIYALPAAHEVGIKGVVRSIHGLLQASPTDNFRKTFIKYDWTIDEIKEELSLEEYCRFTICVSRELQNKIVNYGFPRNKILVIHNCVDVDYFSSSNKSQDCFQTRSELEITKNTVVIGFIGRLELCKNPLILPTICMELRKHLKNFVFCVIGEGPLKDKLLLEIQKLKICPHFLIMEPTIEIKKLLSAIDILLVPSLTEGCPNIVLEGMSMGIPVVATSVGAIPEIITHGVNGFMFNSHNINAVIEYLVFLISKSRNRKKIGLVGRKTILKNFQINNKIQKLVKLYEELLYEC